MPTRIPATEVTEAVVGRVLVEFSHNGEDPRNLTVRKTAGPLGDGSGLWGRKGDLLHEDFDGGPITAVRHSDEDNTVVVILGPLTTVQVYRRADDGALERDNYGRRVPERDENGAHLRVPVDPPTGWTDIGLGAAGWIEVEELS